MKTTGRKEVLKETDGLKTESSHFMMRLRCDKEKCRCEHVYVFQRVLVVECIHMCYVMYTEQGEDYVNVGIIFKFFFSKMCPYISEMYLDM